MSKHEAWLIRLWAVVATLILVLFLHKMERMKTECRYHRHNLDTVSSRAPTTPVLVPRRIQPDANDAIVASAPVRTNMPPDFVLLCNEAGFYKWKIESVGIVDRLDVYTNRQECVDNAWDIYRYWIKGRTNGFEKCEAAR